MKILVLDEWIPYPLDSGKKIRTFNLLSPLAQKHDITYLCYADHTKDKDKINQMEKRTFKIVSVPPIKKYHSPTRLAFGIITNLFSSMPLVVRKHISKRYAEAIKKVLERSHFDLVHCEWTHYGHFLRQVNNLPKLLSSHNIEHIPWGRFYKSQRNPLRKLIIYFEALKMRFYEQNIVKEFHHITAVSENDARIFKSWNNTLSVDIIENGVDINYYKNKCRKPEDGLLVFSASFDSFVNQDAVFYFTSQIFPIIQAQCPNVRFMVLGRKPPPSIMKLQSDRIIVTGTVADVRPYLAKTTVSLVPLRIAGGSRLKILEAFAAGVPVVSTSIGAEGLDAVPNKDILIGDDEYTFAEHCISLIKNISRRNKLINSARALVQSKYDWNVIYPKLEKAWKIAINKFQNSN